MASSGVEIALVAQVGAEFGDPTAGVGHVRVRLPGSVQMLSPRAVRVLGFDKPVGGAASGAKRRVVTRRAMPRRESVENLRRVEDRRLVTIFRDLEPRKRAAGQLDREQKLDAAPRAFVIARESRLRLEREESGNDVPGRLRV